MKGLARWRAVCLPLLALLGIAALIGGVFQWHRFYRDVYIEEESALRALAGELGGVRYRRIGDLDLRELNASAAMEEVPWSVPFVGRVEYVDAGPAQATPFDETTGEAPAYYQAFELAQRARDGSQPAYQALPPRSVVGPQLWAREAGRQAAEARSQAARAETLGAASAMQARLDARAAEALAIAQQAQAALRAPAAPPQTPIASRSTRDRVLRLPGLRGFRDATPRFTDTTPLAEKGLALGRSLPKPAAGQLHSRHLAEDFPTGEALDDESRRALAAEVATAWAQPPVERPRLVRVARLETYPVQKISYPSSRLHLFDGQRRLDFLKGPPGSAVTTNLALSTGDATWEFALAAAERAAVSRIDASLDEAREPPPLIGLYDIERPFGMSALDRDLPETPLGPEGEWVVAAERLDRTRVRLDAQIPPGADQDEPTWRFRTVVRTDLGHAIEQLEWRVERFGRIYNVPYVPPDRLLVREIRWLKKQEGEPVITERISDRLAESSKEEFGLKNWTVLPPAQFVVYERFATEFDPEVADGDFDPSKYGAAEWDRRADLPVLRAYRAAWIAGGGALLLSAIGTLFLRPAVRRVDDESRKTRRADALRSPRWPALRFGLLTIAAAALVVIGGAGWVKRKLDDAEAERALLVKLSEIDDELSFTRTEPEFPWMFFATDAFPVGTPLASVTHSDDVPPELVETLLRASPAIHWRRRAAYFTADVTDAEKALGRELPAFDEFAWRDREEFDPIPRGEALPPAEQERSLREMKAAWRTARENQPRTYLLRRQAGFGFAQNLIAARDGERAWTTDLGAWGDRIETVDDSFRRRFAYVDGEWRLTERRAREEEPLTYRVTAKSAFSDTQTSEEIDLEAEARLPQPPFAMPMRAGHVARRLDEALFEGAPDVAATVERLPEGRYRVELAWTPKAEDGTRLDGSKEATWVLVVRPDLDWAVEACDVAETYPRDEIARALFARSVLPPLKTLAEISEGADPLAAFQAGTPSPYGPAPDDPSVTIDPSAEGDATTETVHEIRVRNRLRRTDAGVFVTEAQLSGEDWPDYPTIPPTTFRREYVRYAIDTDAKFDRPIFDRAAVDAPDPPLPTEDTSIRWYGVTLIVGLSSLGLLGVRRIVEAWRSRRRRVAIHPDDAATEGDA